MKINQVEELVGITKKNIRFYEEQGLLKPDRNPENGYRDYNLKDVDYLMKIKLLRKLSVPIEEIRLLKEGNMSLNDCMEKQIVRLNHEQRSIDYMKKLCVDISAKENDISKLDASGYLMEMKQMEEGGTIFMDIEKKDIKKKKYGSGISALVVISFIIAFLGLVLWDSSANPIPAGLLVLILVIYGGIIVGIIVALKQRLKEINGGEEDEARKY